MKEKQTTSSSDYFTNFETTKKNRETASVYLFLYTYYQCKQLHSISWKKFVKTSEEFVIDFLAFFKKLLYLPLKDSPS